MAQGEAVIDTGDRRYVFVETAPGHFDPRVVTTGERSGEQLEILEGVQPGKAGAEAFSRKLSMNPAG